MHDYVNTAQAAQELGIDESHVRLLCRRGRIVGAKKVGRDWWIRAPVCYPDRRPAGRPGSREMEV